MHPTWFPIILRYSCLRMIGQAFLQHKQVYRNDKLIEF